MSKLERKVIIEIIKKALYIWTGLCLFVVGVVFSLFPFVPGFIPVIIGIAFIAKGSKTFRKQHYIKRFLKYVKVRLKNEKGFIRRLASFF